MYNEEIIEGVDAIDINESLSSALFLIHGECTVDPFEVGWFVDVGRRRRERLVGECLVDSYAAIEVIKGDVLSHLITGIDSAQEFSQLGVANGRPGTREEETIEGRHRYN
ncbi:hypothetical protein PMAYCL1PPCAC_30731 [Pristionchus mayeri]|uniref:Uncharacterized protein n=1 Tax=Pristionchus mayeri TaxID=1317129 RepID=A0AAN5DCJ9_9BILA|nr:hypothetical protein PMAYCL1PPCAC_30731 [Pristionchus mayeri]